MLKVTHGTAHLISTENVYTIIYSHAWCFGISAVSKMSRVVNIHPLAAICIALLE